METPATDFTHEQFVKVRDLIYTKLGLSFEDKRVEFIQKRIQKRVAARRMESTEEYIRYIRFQDASGAEMQELANLVTTNETYMFREFAQLRAFTDFALPEILTAIQAAGVKSLRIWSAGCSTGEEPYTLAIILREVLSDFDSWNIEIAATDVDQNALNRVQQAVYDQRSVKDVPAEYFARHLQKKEDGFHIRPETAQLVTSKHLNLHDRADLRTMRNYDFIFCRNVLIYFSEESRKRVVDYFYTSLNPGGYIFLGHSESIGRISSAFTLVRLGDFLAYKKS